jgi:hypothetical protein
MKATIHYILFKDQPSVYAVDIGQNDTVAQLRAKIHKSQKPYFAQAVLPPQLRLWKLLPPVHKDHEDNDDLKKIYISLNNNNKNPYGLEKVRLKDKIGEIFKIPEEQQALIQVLVQVGLDNAFGIESIFLGPEKC